MLGQPPILLHQQDVVVQIFLFRTNYCRVISKHRYTSNYLQRNNAIMWSRGILFWEHDINAKISYGVAKIEAKLERIRGIDTFIAKSTFNCSD